jgi:parvulin-like peptidyl-prolyl isomerase
MISFFRKASTSWFLLAILGIVIVAFIVTGIGDPFGGRAARLVAKVGPERITDTAFITDFQRQFEMARQQEPELTQERFVNEGGFDMVQRSLVQRTSLQALFDEVGLITGPKTLADSIGAIPAFQLAGQFSTKAYQEALAAARPPLTPAEFETAIAQDLVREKVLGRIGGGWQMPSKAVQAYARLFAEQRTASILVIPADAMTGIALPDDATVARFYEANKAAYNAPEFRAFRVLSLNAGAIAPTIQVTPADVEVAFKERAAELGGVETRTIEQVLVESPQAAQALIAQVKGGTGFVAAAQAAVPGLTADDVVRPNLNQAQFAEEVGAAAAKAVFELASGAVSPPIASELGTYVFRVASVTPARIPSLDAVRVRLESDVRQAKAVDRLFDLVKAVEDGLGAGQSLDDVAKQAGLPIATIPAVDASGAPQSAGPRPDVEPAVLKLAYSHTQGDDLLLEQVGENQFAVVEITDTIPAAPQPLAAVRPRVIADWLRQQQVARAKQVAQELVAAVKGGQTLAAAGAARRLPVQNGVTLMRAQVAQAGNQMPAAIQAMFRTPMGQVIAEPTPDGRGMVVVQVTQVTPSTAGPGSDPYVALQQLLAQSATQEAQEQFVRATMASLKVVEYPERIRAIRTQLLNPGGE